LGGVLLVNCDSVERPKDGDAPARFATLEARREDVSTSIHRVAYHTRTVAREMRSAGLPDEIAEKLVAAA
jgi:hypothetical protein